MRNMGNPQMGQLTQTGNFNDVLHHRVYFGTSGNGASVIASQEIRLFENGVGQSEKNISTGSVVTLKECDSSQDGKGGTIPNGQAFVCAAIGILVSVSNVQATTPFTDDAVTSIDVTPVYRGSGIPLVEALSQQCTFELWRNSDIRLEKGVINEYPCQFGLQGFAGGGQASVPVLGAGPAQAAYTNNHTGLIQTNGILFRPLTVYQVLEQLDQFYGVLMPQRQIDLAATKLTGHVDFYLVGLLANADTARQIVDAALAIKP